MTEGPRGARGSSAGVWTVVGIVVAVVVAWFVVDAVLSLAWLAVRLGLVAVVALVVYLALRSALSRGER